MIIISVLIRYICSVSFAAGSFLAGTPIPAAHGSNHGLTPFGGGSVGLSGGPPSMMGMGSSPVGGLRSGLGASISSPFRSTANSSLSGGLGSSLGLGSSFNGAHGLNREWGRVSSSPASYHSWLSRETEREKERELERGRERERERERDRERERERERERDRSRDRDQDRDKERGRLDSSDRVSSLLPGKLPERERGTVHISDEEGDSSLRQRDRDKPLEGRRSPGRPSHSTGFNIASLTSTEPKPETSSSQEMRSSFERSSSTSASVSSALSSGRREEPKLHGDRRSSDDHDLVILSSDRHSAGHSHGMLTSSYMDKRNLFDDRERPREPYDLARLSVRPPVPHRIGGYPPPHVHPHAYSLPHSHTHPHHIPPPSIFAHGGSLVNPYLSGAAMSAVTHPPGIPGFLPPRGMLGLPLPGLGPRSRSPGDGVGAEHARTAADILLATPDGRP